MSKAVWRAECCSCLAPLMAGPLAPYAHAAGDGLWGAEGHHPLGPWLHKNPVGCTGTIIGRRSSSDVRQRAALGARTLCCTCVARVYGLDAAHVSLPYARHLPNWALALQVVADAVKEGVVTEAMLDTALANTFTTRFRVGEFDPPPPEWAGLDLTVVNSLSHRALAREAAAKGAGGLPEQ
jgi:hypothetical protein